MGRTIVVLVRKYLELLSVGVIAIVMLGALPFAQPYAHAQEYQFDVKYVPVPNPTLAGDYEIRKFTATHTDPNDPYTGPLRGKIQLSSNEPINAADFEFVRCSPECDLDLAAVQVSQKVVMVTFPVWKTSVGAQANVGMRVLSGEPFNADVPALQVVAEAIDPINPRRLGVGDLGQVQALPLEVDFALPLTSLANGVRGGATELSVSNPGQSPLREAEIRVFIRTPDGDAGIEPGQVTLRSDEELEGPSVTSEGLSFAFPTVYLPGSVSRSYPLEIEVADSYQFDSLEVQLNVVNGSDDVAQRDATAIVSVSEIALVGGEHPGPTATSTVTSNPTAAPTTTITATTPATSATTSTTTSDAAATPIPSTGSDGPSESRGDTELALTGATGSWLVPSGLVLLALGVAALLIARRRAGRYS